MSKEETGERAIREMVARGEVPTPAKVNEAMGTPRGGFAYHRINGRLTAYRTRVMLDAGFFRAHKDDPFSGRWFPPGAEIPEGWTRDAD